MLETFLILLAGGIMLAAAIPNPRDVTLNWLRLAGILSLCFASISLFWFCTHAVDRSQIALLASVATIVCVLLQLAFAQTQLRRAQRAMAISAFIFSIACGELMLHQQWFLLAGIAAMCGIALMDMLIGHAYLTASKMPMTPFKQLNAALAIVLAARVACNVAAAIREPFWGRDGLLIGTRGFVGLLVPAAFVYMAHDCIKRRATQSATGILYVAGVLIFIGEIVALQLVRDTGLPW